MKWDNSTDRLILLAILETNKVSIDYEAVARKIGNGCTAGAVCQQVHKLKRLSQNNNQDMGKKPTAYKKPMGGTKKGYFDGKEDTKDIKPIPYRQRKVKFEQPEPVMEEKQVVVKKERRQQTQMSSLSGREVIIIS